uniref:Helicase C-terminal domain-containing protein n=1 Tax=Globodera pallida TaxID=36090 RepID=A0A183CGK7_GLOPA
MSWRPRDFNMRQILPSDYQVELVGRAICQNTIIPLSKNGSKIFVSIQLIKEYSHRLMRNHEKAVLLVNSEERATQIEFHSSLKVLRIGGGFSDSISELIKESQVLVISPQIFLGLLNKKVVDLKMVALLILDDCHHCLIESHPYCQIMKKYRTLSAKRPRILGLTPSLLNKRVSPSNIKGTAKRLERILHSRLETASDLAIICKYVNKPKKFIVCAKNDGTEKLRVFIEINTDFREEVTQVDPRKPILETLLKALVKWETEMFGHLKVDFLVDNNYPPCESGEEERKLANKKLEQTLQRFRNGQLNVLVTTNVLEEGVDIRNCNLVIRFDVPVDFRSFVLSSGRARRENGAFYIITEERNYASLVNELENYSKIEEL